MELRCPVDYEYSVHMSAEPEYMIVLYCVAGVPSFGRSMCKCWTFAAFLVRFLFLVCLLR